MFQPATGLSYQRFFRRLHAAHVFDWYLEIGCRTGRILDLVQGKTIGVDPVFRMQAPVLGRKPQLHLFQETSDAFFAADRLAALGARPVVSFIDGMHLFEFALRDFIGIEAAASPDGVVYVHDCFPFDHAMTTRDLSNLPAIWTGDVWKLIPILQAHRPDLTLTALDAAPTGLLMIEGLDPESRVLSDAMTDILGAYTELTLEEFGVERFFDLLGYTSADEVARNDVPSMAARARPDLALDAPQLVTP
ncbi:MAG: hypothetical protein AAGM21_12135 [Pseudomonadota bacterium]